MGKFIIGTLFLLIQISIFVQGYNQMAVHYTKQSIVTIVETHAQMARMQGYFTPELKRSLIDNIENLKRVDAENVKYDLTETLVCTREHFTTNDQIKYEIIVPIKLKTVKLFGASGDDILEYPQRGIVTSEKKCGEI